MQPDPRQPRHYPPAPLQVYLFATCLVDLFVPQAGLDCVRLLERVKGDLELYGTVEQFPKMEGRQLVMVLAPIKKQEKKH